MGHWGQVRRRCGRLRGRRAPRLSGGWAHATGGRAPAATPRCRAGVDAPRDAGAGRDAEPGSLRRRRRVGWDGRCAPGRDEERVRGRMGGLAGVGLRVRSGEWRLYT